MADKPIIGGYNHKKCLTDIKRKEKEQAEIIYAIVTYIGGRKDNTLTGEHVKQLGIALGLSLQIIEHANEAIEIVTNVSFEEKKMQYRRQRASGE